MENIEELIRVSRRIGERFDLVQAGGGNTSFKQENKLYVKASGVRLSDIQLETHFAVLDNQKLLSMFSSINWDLLSKKEKEEKSNFIVQESNLTSSRRPSIETLLHAICPGVVLHTHPFIIVENFSTEKNIFHFAHEFIFAPYSTPGIELALEVDKARKSFLKKYNREPLAIILENHGMVVYEQTPKKAFEKTLLVLDRIRSTLGISNTLSETYSICNFISNAMENIFKESFVTIFAGKVNNPNLAILPVFFPDGVVFLGARALKTSIESIENDIQGYFQEYTIPPKVFLLEDLVFITAKTFAKAKEIQEVWNLHYTILESQKGNVNFLSEEEVFYLSHWEAEKYRQVL